MADIEKVKQGLRQCSNYDGSHCNDCPYWDDELDCTAGMSQDALYVIEEQQAEIERLQPKTVNPVKPLDVDDDYTYLCDSCKGELFCGDVLRDHFCPSCGGRIEWKDGDVE